jgi:hypothetical protein
MLPSGLRSVEDRDGTAARSDYPAVGKANPLPLELREELIADSPVLVLIFAPRRMKLFGNLGWQLIRNTLHKGTSQFFKHSTNCSL